MLAFFHNYLSYIKKLRLISKTPVHFTSLGQIDIKPVFVIGANRSGTSLTAALFGQHPDVEGITSGAEKPATDQSGHTIAYCEAMHVWPFLLPRMAWKAMIQKDGPLWGHPRHIQHFYADHYTSEKDALLMANRLQQFRATQKQPLLKDTLNTLRVGMICAIFPKARFVFITRDHANYARSCGHKWFENQERVNDITLHWLTINTVAMHDLERFAPSRFATISYETLLGSPAKADATLKEACRSIGLPAHDFDLSMISRKHCQSCNENGNEHPFTAARQAGSFRG